MRNLKGSDPFIRRVARRAARRYVPGPRLEDALAARVAAERRGLATTFGYWDAGSDTPAEVERRAAEALAALTGRSGAELSLKLPALGLESQRVARLAAAAHGAGVALHCDSLEVGVQEAVLALAAGAGPPLGVTLPARWARSAADAERAIAAGLRVRVVKGQFADARAGPAPRREARARLMALVDLLAGRAAHVAVATHDAPLAARAAECLARAGTPFELQVLYGLPAREVEAVARDAGVALRLYVPYGSAYLPYALRSAWREPRMIARLGRDVLAPYRAETLR